LAQEPELSSLLYRLDLVPEQLEQHFRSIPLPDDQLQPILMECQVAAQQAKKPIISSLAFFRQLLTQAPLQQFLEAEKISVAEAQQLADYYHERNHIIRRSQEWWNVARHRRTGGIAKEWSVSYTTALDSFTVELTADINLRADLLPLYTRSTVVDEAVRQLNKAQGQNIVLVGPYGSGRKEIFYHLASKILNYQTKTELDGFQVRVLQTTHLLSSASTPAALQGLLEQLFSDVVRAKNVILFVDQIDLLLDPTGKLGSANISGLLDSYLTHREVRLIGSTTTEKFYELIKPNQTLLAQLTPIEVPLPSPAELQFIVLSQLSSIENRYRVFFLLTAVKQAVALAERYIKDQASPKRELDLLEEIAAEVHGLGRSIVEDVDVIKVVERKSKVPIQVNEAEQHTLLNLKAELHKRIIGQDRALEQISNALLRARAGLASGKKPVGSFLFLGPTGVGKTETAKALSAIYFGSEDAAVRLDLSEYAQADSLTKLLGTNAASDPGALTVAIQDHPSAVVLFDEIEKSHPQVRSLFLQLLDEGRLTTNYGKALDFTNSIIIATSNAGSDIIQQAIQAGNTPASIERGLLDSLISQKIFAPEFLNRFDGVIIFSSLTPAEVKQVVVLRLQELTARLREQKQLELELAPAVVTQLAEKGYDPVFGARALDRLIKTELETVIAREIIAQQPKPGSKLIVSSL
jgi:ATP-dependent Clp protease ATP-binding subunit ClpA